MTYPTEYIAQLESICDALEEDLKPRLPEEMQRPGYPFLSRSGKLPPDLEEYADGIVELEDAITRLDRFFKRGDA
jgi:hypothetical protein